MTNRDVMEKLYLNLEGLADHCMARFRLPNNRSLVVALGQPNQISNRSALIVWIGSQILDPDISNDADLCNVLCERLALLLVDVYPHRWAEILGDVLREDSIPDFAFLTAMRHKAMGVRA